MMDASDWWFLAGCVAALVVGVIIHEWGRETGAKECSRWWEGWTGISSQELERGAFERELGSLRWMIGKAHEEYAAPHGQVGEEEEMWDANRGVYLTSRSGKLRIWLGRDDGWELRIGGQDPQQWLRIGLSLLEGGKARLVYSDRHHEAIAALIIDVATPGGPGLALTETDGHVLWSGSLPRYTDMLDQVKRRLDELRGRVLDADDEPDLPRLS